MKRINRLWKLSGLAIASICFLTSLGPLAKEADDTPREPASYIRSIKQEESTRLVLQAAGTYSVGFEYQIPADKQAVVTLLARKNKQIIKSLSRILVIGPKEIGSPNQDSIRLTMIDPEKFIEGYTGKIHWLFDYRFGTKDSWEPPNYTRDYHSKSAWPAGKTFNDPELDKDYLLWVIKTYPEGVTSWDNDTPADFEYQILFRMETSEEGPRAGGSTINIGDYETAMEERKTRLEKK